MALERTVVLVGSLTVLCFLFALKVCALLSFHDFPAGDKVPLCRAQALYGGVSAGIDPQHVICEIDLTELRTRNEQQTVKYQQLAQQIHQLEVRAASLCGDGDVHTAAAVQAQHLKQGHHQLAVIVPYRDREAHLARLVLQLDTYLTVSDHLTNKHRTGLHSCVLLAC